MKETRGRLCTVLGRPHNHGKIVIQKTQAGFRINPLLFTVDL